jgi:hypothetical protein
MLHSIHAVSSKDATVSLAYFFDDTGGPDEDKWEAALAEETRLLWPKATGGVCIAASVGERPVAVLATGDVVFLLSGDVQEDELSCECRVMVGKDRPLARHLRACFSLLPSYAVLPFCNSLSTRCPRSGVSHGPAGPHHHRSVRGQTHPRAAPLLPRQGRPVPARGLPAGCTATHQRRGRAASGQAQGAGLKNGMGWNGSGAAEGEEDRGSV